MRRRNLVLTVGAALVLLVVAVSADAAVFQCRSGDVDCLIAAVNAANSNGKHNTIHLAEGIYPIGGTAGVNGQPSVSLLPSLSGHLTIVGAGSAATIIEAVRISSGEAPHPIDIEPSGSLVLRGVTVRNGEDWEAGGIWNRGSAVLDNVIVTNNSAIGNGAGGVFNEGSMLIVDSEVSHNAGDTGAAGGISNGSFFDDTGPTRTLTIVRTVIKFNGGGFNGIAGIFNGPRSDLRVTDSAVTENTSSVISGVWNLGSAYISRSALVGNVGGFQGAVLTNEGSLIVESTTVAKNRQVASPVIRSTDQGRLVLLNDTIADNTAIGIFIGPLQLQNTIVARNVTGGFCQGSITSLGNNFLDDPAACPITLQTTDLTGDPGLGELTDIGVIPLLKTSPAIDAGNPSECPALDQRKLPRVDETGLGIVACDIGAVEFIDHVVGIKISPRRLLGHPRARIDVLGSADFNLETLDLSTVRAGVTGYEASPLAATFKDLDRDRDFDFLRLRFGASELGVACDTPIIAFTAKTVSGGTVAGSAEVSPGKCEE